jgi:membrane-bound ClpP family serine protease
MIVLGVVLLVVGLLAPIGILTTVGIVLIVAGAVLALLGSAGREIGGRRYWY